MIDFHEKQVRILDAAEQLIFEKGHAESSVREICARANINIAMVSYYFGSKGQMLHYLYENKIRKATERFGLLTQTIANASPALQLNEILKFLISHLSESYYLQSFAPQGAHNPAGEYYIGIFTNLAARKLGDLIQKGIAIGEFHRAVRAEDLLATIWGTIIFSFQHKEFYQDFLPTREGSNYGKQVQTRLKTHLTVVVFSLLGYRQG